MPEGPQQVTSNVTKPRGGVLPISIAQTNARNNQTPATPPQRLKTVIRRLPPGLTQAEFHAAIGEEWGVGQGKISWVQFRPGKIAKDASKPSKPARAYLQLTQQAHLDALAEKLQQTSFADAKKTDNDSSLLGPPTLEFAPYNRVPFGRKRHDARQGLIDQDPEFIQFLEELTNPITKAAAEVEAKPEKPKTTPLIEALRQKKAAKEAAKENKDKASPQKAGKHARQTSKTETADTPPTVAASKAKGAVASPAIDRKAGRASKVEKVAAKNTPTPSKATPPVPGGQPAGATSAKPPQSPKAAAVAPARRPEGPGGVSAAARMIQRDLGIRGGRGGSLRGARGGRTGPVNGAPAANVNNAAPATATPPAIASATPGAAATPPTAPAAASTPSATPQPPTTNGAPITPAASTPSTTTTTTTPASSSVTPKAPTPTPPTGPETFNKPAPGTHPPNTTRIPPKPVPLATSTQAFLKHANPSQGITEPLLHEAFTAFGDIKKVEIDKRKGFAYVDFADNAGLAKAMLASPVKVASGSVQVLERRDGVRNMGTVGSLGVGRGAGASQAMLGRGGPSNVGVGFRGARGMRGGRGGMMRGAFAAGNQNQGPPTGPANTNTNTNTNAPTTAAAPASATTTQASAPAASTPAPAIAQATLQPTSQAATPAASAPPAAAQDAG